MTDAVEPTQTDPLTDAFGRAVRDLRVSVTDRCNFRCTYCMPQEEIQWLPREGMLTFEEISRVVSVLASMGLETVRLTGGEPLMRKDFPELVERLVKIDGIQEVSITTNGVLLERQLDDLVAAGLGRVNVSLDTLVQHRFTELTRRDALDRVLAGLAACEQYPQLGPIKVNAVAMRDFSEPEILDFAALARKKPYVVRYIELMPLDGDRDWDATKVLPADEIRNVIHDRWPLEQVSTGPAATATRWRFADGAGEMGFIAPVTQPFCEGCDRLRLTSDGQLRTCLFSTRETDMRLLLREGIDDAALAQSVADAVWQKEAGHLIGNKDFAQPRRTMHAIGG